MLFNFIIWVCTLKITSYFFAIFIGTVLALAICCQAAYENSDDFLHKKANHPDFAIRAHTDCDRYRLEARAKCLRILQEWRNDIHKQTAILGSRLEKKHTLVRRHCKTIVDILREELLSTEAQVKVIAQDDPIDSVMVSQFVEAQLSTVRIFVDDLENCLARVPKLMDYSEC